MKQVCLSRPERGPRTVKKVRGCPFVSRGSHGKDVKLTVKGLTSPPGLLPCVMPIRTAVASRATLAIMIEP